MTIEGADQRRHPRREVAFPIIVRDGERTIGTIEDISAGGMRVRLDAEVGENVEVREWTGRKAEDNREFVLESAVGEVFTFSIHFMGIRFGEVKARLIRVIRRFRQLYFAMQFEAPDEAVIAKIMGVVERRSGRG
jgi:uncharacterized protein Veg